MNKDTVKTLLSNGSFLHVEVTDARIKPACEEHETAGSPPLPVIFSLVAPVIEGIVTDVAQVLSRIGPTKAVVEFGLELGVESNRLTALLVKGTGRASLKITMEWRNSQSCENTNQPNVSG